MIATAAVMSVLAVGIAITAGVFVHKNRMAYKK